MKLYLVQHPTNKQPTYAAGDAVAALIRAAHPDAVLTEVPDQEGPAGASTVETVGIEAGAGSSLWMRVGRFKAQFMPEHAGLLFHRVQQAKQHNGYYSIMSDRDCLCVSGEMRLKLMEGLRKLA